MSRHRAEPDDEETLPPPTADTGPLMFGHGDWPPLRPPEPDGDRRASSTRNGAPEPTTRHPQRDPAPSYERPSEDLPTYRADVHNHVTSKINYPLRERPVQVAKDWPGERPSPPTAAPAELPRRAPRASQVPMRGPVDQELLDEDAHHNDAHIDDPADELGLLTPEPEPDKGHRRGRGPRTARKGGRRPLAILLSLGLIAALVTGIYYGGRAVVDLISDDPVADYSGQGTGSVEIQVPEGAPTADIADILAENDVVASAQAFLAAAAGNSEILNIQPGVYAMRRQMSGQAAVDLILDPASRLFDRVTIPEGYTVARTLETLAEKSDIPLADFQAVAADPTQLGLPAWSNGQLEGLLFPATYDIGPDSTAVSVLTEMLARFNEAAVETGLEANAAAVGLTPYEALTVASLVQSEVTVEAERPIVARVIYNRLAISMPLGIDAALAYELGVNGNELTTEMLTTDSPYNTRIRIGLPPTPISNPGQASMLGALQPAVGDWLYYVLQTAAGDHYFTNNYEDFLAAKARCEASGLGCG
ncbi:MAG: endolytic transglycosylase MltG [Actinomycetota bacterium]|nr:endolytic transglycosylase MltG [Actinomycetota bacterium]